MRCMTRPKGKPGKPRHIRIVSHMVRQITNCLIHQVFRQVIARGEIPRRIDMTVIAHQFRCVVIRFRIQKTIKMIKPPAQWPTIKRARGTTFAQWGHMPFAHHVIAIGMRFQHFRQRSRRTRYLAAIAGKTTVEIRQTTDADGMMISPS